MYAGVWATCSIAVLLQSPELRQAVVLVHCHVVTVCLQGALRVKSQEESGGPRVCRSIDSNVAARSVTEGMRTFDMYDTTLAFPLHRCCCC